MEEADILKGRIKDLSSRCQNESYLTHTDFLSLSEQSLFFNILKEERVSLLTHKYAGVSYCLYGGHNDDDRKIIFFLPYYMSEAELKDKEQEGDIISCIHVYPKNEKYCDFLTHRDYLGALMHLGFRREMFGDILTDGKEGYLFVLSQVAQQVKEELIKIKHTSVECEIIPPKNCLFSPRFEERSINISSNRLDAIIGEVYHASRRDAQVLIASESVFLNGMVCKNNAHELKPNDRVSIAGKGKFIFLGEKSLSRKGRLFANTKVYC